jgi:hypothetical protein
MHRLPWLARVEARITLNLLLARFPTLERGPEPAVQQAGPSAATASPDPSPVSPDTSSMTTHLLDEDLLCGVDHALNVGLCACPVAVARDTGLLSGLRLSRRDTDAAGPSTMRAGHA